MPPPRIRQHAPFRRAWKLLVSGTLFGLLGLGGLAGSWLVLPVLRLLPGGRAGLRRRTGALIRWAFRGFLGVLGATGILRVQVELDGAGPLAGALVVCNHPSYLDVVVLLGFLPDAVCLVKPAVAASPWFGAMVRAAGHFPAGDPEAVLEAAQAALGAGLTLVLFPEGTRSRPGQPFHFQRGWAHLACRTGARTVPLVLSCVPDLLGPGHRWYHVPLATCRFRVRVGVGAGLERAASERVTTHQAVRRLNAGLEGYYDKEVYGTQQGRHPEPTAGDSGGVLPAGPQGHHP
jgi:1-acyl-sn-glycerol-3-phosphate acyltransferase